MAAQAEVSPGDTYYNYKWAGEVIGTIFSLIAPLYVTVTFPYYIITRFLFLFKNLLVKILRATGLGQNSLKDSY